VNDTAHFLAGLPVSEGSSFLTLTRDPVWQRHATFFDQSWTKLDARQLTGIRTWEAGYLPDASQPLPVVFYMFSGPDLLYAEQFFPNARTYILAGTEPIGPLPDILRYAGPSLDPVLQNLEKSLNSVLNFSFFITKDMKTELQREDLKGTLPIFYVFLARSGKSITDITFITLDKSGQPHISGPGEKARPYPASALPSRRAGRGAPDPLLLHHRPVRRRHPFPARLCEILRRAGRRLQPLEIGFLPYVREWLCIGAQFPPQPQQSHRAG
jgi:hypothetical protein